MVIIQVAGGLGNQLQQYALYRKFLSLSKEAKLDISWFGQGQKGENVTGRKLELDYFAGLPYTACTAQEKAAMTGGDGLTGKLRRKLLPGTVRQFTEKQIYHPEIFEQDDKYISGYFACEKYYADILPKLREEIRFPESENVKNQEMAEYGLRSTHISCLYYLYTAKGLTATELCEKCEEDKASVSRAVDYLKENGYVTSHQGNKRYKIRSKNCVFAADRHRNSNAFEYCASIESPTYSKIHTGNHRGVSR